MKKTTILVILSLLLVLCLSSCAVFQSRSTRAQHHLAKAISLDPSLVQNSTRDSVRIKDSINMVTKVRIKDSINIQTKDSVIIIPKTEISGSVKSPCDSTGRIKDFDQLLGLGANKLHLWAVDGVLYYRSSVDSLVSVIKTREAYNQKLQDSLSSLARVQLDQRATHDRQVITITKNRFSFLQILGYSIVLLLVGFVAGKLLKIRIGIFGA